MLLTRSAGASLSQQVYSILQKYGTDAHLYLPGIGVINGLTAGNYLDSAGTTAATVDNPVGLVVDSGGINAIQATTANKPILRKGAVNLLTYSEQFDNAAWVKTGGTVTPNATTAPDGTLTADLLVIDSASDFVLQTLSVIAGLPYTFSIYVKTDVATKIRLILDSGTAGNVSSDLDVTTGWTRISFSGVCTVTGNRTFGLRGASVSPSNIYAFGAQLETGSTATTYAPTTTAAASNLVGGYHWVHDSTDLLTATFPAGYESATTINASTAGQSTLTAQNIVGAYSIGPSVDTYGRIIFKAGCTASELATIQQYANRLAGL
jgi:hypothetical protein